MGHRKVTLSRYWGAMAADRCSVCGRIVAQQNGGLRPHKTIGRPINGRNERGRMTLDQWRAAGPAWCWGGAQQLRLPEAGE